MTTPSPTRQVVPRPTRELVRRHRLPHQRPRRRESIAGEGHRLDQPRRPPGPHRADHSRPHPEPPRRRRAGLLRPAPHIQRPNGGDKRPPGTPTRHRPGLSQPHQLHHTITTRNRRLQTPTTPLNRMSRYRGRNRSRSTPVASAMAPPVGTGADVHIGKLQVCQRETSESHVGGWMPS